MALHKFFLDIIFEFFTSCFFEFILIISFIELENDELHTYSDLYSISKTRRGSSKRIISYTMDLGDDKNVEIRANQKSHMIFVDVYGAYPDSEGLLGAAPKEGKLSLGGGAAAVIAERPARR